jgi:DNA-directed RNA polymerase subunit N (RpoN/RPB10)
MILNSFVYLCRVRQKERCPARKKAIKPFPSMLIESINVPGVALTYSAKNKNPGNMRQVFGSRSVSRKYRAYEKRRTDIQTNKGVLSDSFGYEYARCRRIGRNF